MARGSVVDESRTIAAKIPVTPHHGYVDNELLHKELADWPVVVRQTSSADTTESVHRSSSSTETIRTLRRDNPDDNDATLCSEEGEESACDEPPKFFAERPPSCRRYLATQLAGVMRDGQRLPSARLRGLTLLVLSLVLGCV